MAFVLRKDDKFEFPVEVQVPTATGFETQSFVGVFRRLPTADIQALYGGALQDQKPGSEPMSDLKIANRVFVGWGDDLVDDNGKPVPVTNAHIKRLLDDPTTLSAILRAHVKAGH